MPDNFLHKFAKNKPLFYGTLGLGAVGAIWYYRRQQAANAASSSTTGAATSATGQQTDPAGNVGTIDPQTGYVYGSPEDIQALDQMSYGSGGYVGNPYDGGTYGTGGGSGSGGGGGGGGGGGIQTREQWIAKAQSILPNGHSADVRTALVEVLSGLTVTTEQKRVFLEAVGVLGEPPGGYPKPIKTKDTSGHPQPGDVTVPNVVGDTYSQAVTKLHAAGLTAKKSQPAVKNVGRQSPDAGAKVKKGSQVTLFPGETHHG